MKLIIFVPLLAISISLSEVHSSSYADKLFNEGKYDVAVIEYERLNFFTPDSSFQHKIGLCYLELGKYDHAISIFKELGEVSKVVQLYVALGEYSLARFVCEDVDKNLVGWVYLIEGRWEEASNSFDQEELKLVALNGKLLPYKSEQKALVLSAIVPGLGEAYSGNYIGGLWAFAVNGLSGLYAIKALRRQDYVTFGVVTTFLLHRFYTGSINRAVNSVREYNKAIKARYIKELIEKYGCPIKPIHTE